MDLSNPTTIAIIVGIAGIIAAIVIYVFNRYNILSKGEKRVADILDPGWQFYSKPTTLDAPGTVFRIDDNDVRYKVGKLNVVTTQGKEAAGRNTKSGQVSLGILSSLLGLDKIGIDVKAKKVEQLEFEITDPVKEETSDMAIDKELDSFLEKLEYRADNRYFIIREARLASAMKYYLTEKLVNEITGGVKPIEDLKVEGDLNKGQEGEFELDQTFEQQMRIMFLPEEIVPISVGLSKATPQLGLAPVSEPLVWKEG